MSNMSKRVKEYFATFNEKVKMTDQSKVAKLRCLLGDRWPHPPVLDAWAFLVLEVSELGDALLRDGFGQMSYVRHHEKQPNIANELADAYLMLCTVANHVEVDLSEVLKTRLKHIERRVK